jgi:hypothetical protein
MAAASSSSTGSVGSTWCNMLRMLADGLTKVLPYQCAICALMAARVYQVPVGGKTGRLDAWVTLLTSRIVHVGGTALSVRESVREPAGVSATVFMLVMLISYVLLVVVGLLVAWYCCGACRRPVREFMVVGPEQIPRSGQPKPRTPLTDEQTIAGCCRAQHAVKPGRNQVSIYVTCSDCQHHATWLKNGPPPRRPELAFLMHSWDALQGSGTSSSAAGAVPRPRATTRSAAAAADDDTAAPTAAAPNAAAAPEAVA